MMAKYLMVFLIITTLSISIAGCSQPAGQTSSQEPPLSSAPSQEGSDTEEGQHVMRAMCVPYGDGYFLMFDENGSPFSVTFPEDEIYGISGEKISPEQLQRGNILEIYGNGLMLESYPGQYPGVSKIQVVEEGSPEDADQYQEFMDSFYQEPDPNEPPGMNVEYTTSTAACSAVASSGNMEWTQTTEDGQSKTLMACGAHVLQWKNINVIRLDGETADLTLHFYPEQPKEVQAVRWPVSQQGSTDSAVLDGGETIPIETDADGKWIIRQAQGGYIYRVIGIWDRGQVEFGFLTA